MFTSARDPSSCEPHYHHCRPFAHSPYGIVHQGPPDVDFQAAFDWLASEIGFRPLFMSVGPGIDALYPTGYDYNWCFKLGPNTYRRRGDFPNDVLFSYSDAPPGAIFTDYDAWHMVLHRALTSTLPPTPYESRQILKRSWPMSRWLRQARNYPGSVQVVVPHLDLRAASRIWVRNQPTRAEMERRGFQHVTVRRIPLLR